MGLFNRKQKREDPVKPEEMVNDVLLKAMLSDDPVTREMAMTIPAVSQNVDFIAGAIASMPVKLYRIIKGKIYEQTDDTRVRLLNGDTGDTLNGYELKKALVADFLMAPEGGYAYIERDKNEVVGLYYVENIWLAFERNYKPIYKDFNVLVDGERYYPWDFLKLLRNTTNGSDSIPLTFEVAKALEAAYQTIMFQVDTLKTGGNKKGFIKSEKALTQEAMDKLKAAWRKLYSSNTENVVVLNNGLDFKEASQSATEMQINESKRTFADEINGIFHVYPNDENRTFKEAIYPIVKAFETALNRDLLTEDEKKKGKYFFELDVKEIVRASLSERYAAYKQAKETGFMTLNEIRRAENMTEVDGLDVVNVGLGAVLYDTNKHIYYTPNTDTIGNVGDADEDIQKMIVGKEEMQAFDASGNSAERELRFNPNHDKAGRFAPSGGGGVLIGRPVSEIMKDREAVKELMASGIKNPADLKEAWREANMAETSKNLHEIDEYESADAIREAIPESTLNGWFVNYDSDYKPKIEEALLTNPKARNAAMNIAWRNYNDYLATEGKPAVGFGEFLNKEITVYRGDRGQQQTKNDVFSSYSYSRSAASKFGSNITEIRVKPIETLGQLQTTGEYELLVPRRG